MDNEFSQAYRELERNHWWFRARREILRSKIAAANLPNKAEVLEIGVGSGENLYSLYPDYINLTGIEPFEENADYANKRGNIPVHVGTAENWPAQLQHQNFDAICLFDVLEHLEDDRAALSGFFNRLNPGGSLFLSVPAYQWMWGRQDEVSHHFRRYTRKMLSTRLQDAGFSCVETTYFNTLLFPAIALQRMKQRITKAEGSDFDQSYGRIEELFYRIFRFEQYLLKVSNFPFGVSLFTLARKP